MASILFPIFQTTTNMNLLGFWVIGVVLVLSIYVYFRWVKPYNHSLHMEYLMVLGLASVLEDQEGMIIIDPKNQTPYVFYRDNGVARIIKYDSQEDTFWENKDMTILSEPELHNGMIVSIAKK